MIFLFIELCHRHHMILEYFHYLRGNLEVIHNIPQSNPQPLAPLLSVFWDLPVLDIS